MKAFVAGAHVMIEGLALFASSSATAHSPVFRSVHHGNGFRKRLCVPRCLERLSDGGRAFYRCAETSLRRSCYRFMSMRTSRRPLVRRISYIRSRDCTNACDLTLWSSVVVGNGSAHAGCLIPMATHLRMVSPFPSTEQTAKRNAFARSRRFSFYHCIGSP